MERVREESQKRKSEKRREEKGRKDKRGSMKRKSEAGARKGRKVGKTVFLPVICGPGGSKRRLAKVASAEPACQMKDKKLYAVVARSTFASQMHKTPTASEHF